MKDKHTRKKGGVPYKDIKKFDEQNWGDVAKVVKRYGMVKSVDLRKPLKGNQLRNVKRAFKKHEIFLRRAKYDNKNVIRRVKNPQDYKKAGFAVHGNKVIIPLDGFAPNQVKLRNGVISKHSTSRSSHIDIKKKAGHIFDLLGSKTESGVKLKPGQSVSVVIPGSARFSKRFGSYQLLLNYLSEWEANEDDETEGLLGVMELVTLHEF